MSSCSLSDACRGGRVGGKEGELGDEESEEEEEEEEEGEEDDHEEEEEDDHEEEDDDPSLSFRSKLATFKSRIATLRFSFNVVSPLASRLCARDASIRSRGVVGSSDLPLAEPGGGRGCDFMSSRLSTLLGVDAEEGAEEGVEAGVEGAVEAGPTVVSLSVRTGGGGVGGGGGWPLVDEDCLCCSRIRSNFTSFAISCSASVVLCRA